MFKIMFKLYGDRSVLPSCVVIKVIVLYMRYIRMITVCPMFYDGIITV